jgi:hypothetical protein
MNIKHALHKMQDSFWEWLRYPQPSQAQRKLLGLHTDVIDIEFTARRLASEQSAAYVLDHMRTTPNFASDYDLHHWVATTQLSTDLFAKGTVLEFGVATGRTLNQFSHWLPQKTVWGFDSFEGLPEDWTSRMRRGFFARSSLPRVKSNARLVVGLFDQTLPSFVRDHQQDLPILLLHMDADLYSSTVTVLDSLKKNIVPGTMIIFDEYINYPGWQLDEFRAWQQFCKQHQVTYDYVGLVSRHQKVAVRVTGINHSQG